jgi:amidase
MVPAALGTQTAGSIIRPASYCGAIGFKPTYGMLPVEGIHPLAPSLDTLGFFVQKLEDIPLLLSALTGARPSPIAPAHPRLGLCRTEAWPRAEPYTQRAVEDAARRLGAVDVDLGPHFSGLVDAQVAIMGAEASAALHREPHDGLSSRFQQFLEEGAAVSPEQLGSARTQAERCRAEIDRLFDSFDALLTPAANGEAPEGLAATGDPLFARIWTLLGTPCLSLPLLHGPAGLPVGLQVVGPRSRDATLLSAAAWIIDLMTGTRHD